VEEITKSNGRLAWASSLTRGPNQATIVDLSVLRPQQPDQSQGLRIQTT
jgi:hypothetical protein